jgi:hypothetical protein
LIWLWGFGWFWVGLEWGLSEQGCTCIPRSSGELCCGIMEVSALARAVLHVLAATAHAHSSMNNGRAVSCCVVLCRRALLWRVLCWMC